MHAFRIVVPMLSAMWLLAPTIAHAQFKEIYYEIPGNPPTRYPMGHYDDGAVRWIRDNGTMSITCGSFGTLVIIMNGTYDLNVIGTDGINVTYSTGRSRPGGPDDPCSAPDECAVLSLYCTANPTCALEGNAGNDGEVDDTIEVCTKGANSSCVPIGVFKCVKDPPSQVLAPEVPALSPWAISGLAVALLGAAAVFLRRRGTAPRAA